MKNIDLYMTMPDMDGPGGDLQITAPRVDSEGNTVVDLAISYSNQVIKQIVYSRIITQAPDWFVHPTLGGNLEDLIGEPNTKETAQLGVRAITDALTYDNFLDIGSFTVKAVPVNRDEILFVIRVEGWQQDTIIPIQFNYNYGMKLVEG